MIARRSFLAGLFVAPAIVRASSLMAIKPLPSVILMPNDELTAHYVHAIWVTYHKLKDAPEVERVGVARSLIRFVDGCDKVVLLPHPQNYSDCVQRIGRAWAFTDEKNPSYSNHVYQPEGLSA